MPEKSGKAKAAPKKAPDNKKMPKNQPSPGKDKPPQKKTPPEKSGGAAAFVPYLLVIFALLLAIFFVTVCLLDMDQGAGVVGYVIQMFFCSLLGMGAFLLPAALGYIGVRWILFRLKWKNADRSVESEQFFSYEKSHRRMIMQTVMTLLSILIFSAVIGVIAADSYPGWSYATEYWWEDGEYFHGGLLGNLIAAAMIICFQKVASLVILITLLVLFVLLMLGLTPDYIITKIQYNRAMRREEREIRQAAYEQQAEQLRIEEQQHLSRLAASKAEAAPPAKPAREVATPAAPTGKRTRSMSADDIAAVGSEELKPEPLPEQPAPAEPTTVFKEPEPATVFKDPEPEPVFKDPEGTPLFHAEEGKDYAAADDTFNKNEYAFSVEDIVRSAKLKPETEKPGNAPEIDLNPIGQDELLSDMAAITPDEGEAPEEEEPEEAATPYVFPPVELLKENTDRTDVDYSAELKENAQKLVETLKSFKIGIQEITYSRGPTITRYELKPNAGVRVRAIANLVDDIALNLATSGVRIEAPIPNKPAVGIEVPNRNRATVYLRDLIENPKFKEAKSRLTSCLGMDVGGNPIYFDIAKMPHLLIAGATGMGKSVCINSIIISILYKAKPEEVKLILIDPKKVEFNIYKDIPHLYAPIVSDPKKAAGALASAVAEMERRFELIEEVGVRDIGTYNAVTENDPCKEHMPHMVIIIDELADLMMTAPDEVESSICRLAQKARAAGIHIIIGTQRPSVDVITGLIKANIPSRIACTVASQVDSRTIIDIAGAEKLIGRGDMLFAPVGAAKPMRVQGAFVSESEVESIVSFLKENNAKARYNNDFINRIEEEAAKCGMGKKGAGAPGADTDALDGVEGGDPKFREAVKLAIETQKISTSLMQRKLGIGYGRAAKIIDTMEEMGYVSRPDGNKPRRVLITMEEFMRRVMDGTLESPSEGGSDEE